ncbi:MAG: 1-deoxy-D-xylulose-5-phosphate synthase, partial [Clostridia bacterium]|nr:1-deoxy-D-xylulose-5-phosphate synthase [Clostridia bacterium]
KGKGFEVAEQEPDKYHSTGSFDLQTGKGNETSSKTYSEIFGETLCEIAAEDNKICAITAAMCDGTGLSEFSQRYPDRFFDVGIAEEHAITFAGGLSALGMKPVVALYSTFSQRVYDQILHDISIQNLPLILALDRCGLVPNDGITHQGIFDFSLFSSVPNTEIFSPINGDELASVLKDTAERYDKLSVVRYPKGSAIQSIPQIDMVTDGFVSYSSDVRSADVVIVAAGRLFYNAVAVRDLLKTEYSVGIIRPIRVYPLDYEAFSNLLRDCRLVYILDENYREGGFGEKLAANLNTKARISVRAVEGFVEHGSLADLMRYCGFDPEQIAEGIQRNIQ